MYGLISFLIQESELEFPDYRPCNGDDILQDLQRPETKPQTKGAADLTKSRAKILKYPSAYISKIGDSIGQHFHNQNIWEKEVKLTSERKVKNVGLKILVVVTCNVRYSLKF